MVDATVTYSSTDPGSIATYKCLTGMQFANNHSGIVFCEASGYWSTPPQCEAEKVKCEAPLLFEHGEAFYNSTTVGSSATFICEESYVLIGPSTVTCLESGNWDEEPPHCQSKLCVNDIVF